MIQKLRFRLITASMLALTLVLLVILGGINLVSYQKIIAESDAILALLADNDGRFPMPENDFGQDAEKHKGAPPFDNRSNGYRLSPETPFESRFFRVSLNRQGEVTGVDTSMIASVDSQTAAQWGKQILSSGSKNGFWGDFRYSVSDGSIEIRVFFLDCSRSLSHFRTTLVGSIGIAAAGLLAVLLLLILFAGRIVKPVVESYEKQKRFITDAGHEIKTPLTIIGADLDLAELECEKNEWLQDIRWQVQRLTGLTNDLIALSRMDEERPMLQMIDFPVSDVVEETAQSFQSLATQQGKHLSVSIQPMLSLVGNEKEIRQLLSILLDNAIKYTPDGGLIDLSLEQKGKHLKLTLWNTTAETISKEQVSQFFDRFYRADASRSTSKGYGLGLSIAQGIVNAHKGTIHANSQEKKLVITVSLPIS